MEKGHENRLRTLLQACLITSGPPRSRAWMLKTGRYSFCRSEDQVKACQWWHTCLRRRTENLLCLGLTLGFTCQMLVTGLGATQLLCREPVIMFADLSQTMLSRLNENKCIYVYTDRYIYRRQTQLPAILSPKLDLGAHVLEGEQFTVCARH